MKTQIWRVSILVLMAACAACSKKGDDAVASADSAQAQGEHEGSTAGVPDGSSDANAENLGELVDLIVAEAAELPRAEFDPAVLAKRLGKDPQAHFEWVRDHTWWAPYRGLLRGSQGVMLDRVGSNLDRAVLLGDLLRRSGYAVRLAHAQLSASQAREILAKVRSMPERRRNSVAERPIAAERQRKMESLVPGYEQAVENELAEAKRLSGEASTLARLQADQLLATIRNASIMDRTTNDGATAAMQDHWWVERREGGRWIAMDVLLPDGKQGEALVTASSTSEWNAKVEAPAIPEKDWHEVQVSVIVEKYEDGATSESLVLKTTLRPAEVFTRPIRFRHLPDPWPETIPDSKTDPNALGNTAVNVKRWVPYLEIGDEFVAQSAFTEGGNLERRPFSAQKDISETGGASIMGGFDAALAGGETASSYMTAEWIDYDIHVPGEKSQHLRRPVFDLLGPAQRPAQAAGFDASTNDRMVRRYEALLSSTDIFLQPCDLTSEFASHLRLSGIVENQDDLRKLASESDSQKAMELAHAVRKRIADWGPLLDLALWRSALGTGSSDRFIDRPNVLNYRITQPVVATDRAPTRELIDIVSNGTGVRRAGGDSYEIRVYQGVVDTVVEMLTLTNDLRSAENTASIFAREGTGFDESTLISPRDTGPVKELGWPGDVTARLTADLDAGYLVIVPAKAAVIDGQQRLSWWRVDPESGETIGVMDTGYHGAVAEKGGMDESMESMTLRLLKYERNERQYAATARDFITRPGVRSLGRADMDRLALYTRVTKILDKLGVALLP